MYLDIVIIDYLNVDGSLSTYKILPLENRNRVVIDRLEDIYRDFRRGSEIDIGGVRIYNGSSCSIEKYEAKIRNFSFSENNEMLFQFEHMGIPVGSNREAHGGFYNLLLPPNFKITDLHVVDPYDRTHAEPISKKHFRFNVIWDTACNTSLVKMDLSSGRGTFSFILLGKAKIYNPEDSSSMYLESTESKYAVSSILDYHIIDDNGKDKVAKEISEKSEWLELKPNIFGIGINLNKIIKDCIQTFKRKIKNSD